MNANHRAIIIGVWLAFSFVRAQAAWEITEIFLAADHLTFQVEGTSLEDTVEQLRRETEKIVGFKSPPVEVHRYANNPSTDANPWQLREVLSAKFRSSSNYEILRDICDLNGYQMLADYSGIALFQTPLRSSQLSSLDEVGQSPKKPQRAIESFRNFIIPKFVIKNASPLEAIEKLTTTYAELTGRPAPTIGIIHYFRDSDESPRTLRHITLDVNKESAGEIIRWVGELCNCIVQLNEHTISLAELPWLYHPKKVYTFPAKDIINIFEKPQRRNNTQYFEKLEIPQTTIWGAGYHERSSKVFIITEPESVEQIQSHLKAKKR